jgi:hypothetical protein
MRCGRWTPWSRCARAYAIPPCCSGPASTTREWRRGRPAKTAAVLQERSAGGPVLLRVGFDAGHGMGLTKTQQVEETADVYAFLRWQLGGAARGTVP